MNELFNHFAKLQCIDSNGFYMKKLWHEQF